MIETGSTQTLRVTVDVSICVFVCDINYLVMSVREKKTLVRASVHVSGNKQV